MCAISQYVQSHNICNLAICAMSQYVISHNLCSLTIGEILQYLQSHSNAHSHNRCYHMIRSISQAVQSFRAVQSHSKMQSNKMCNLSPCRAITQDVQSHKLPNLANLLLRKVRRPRWRPVYIYLQLFTSRLPALKYFLSSHTRSGFISFLRFFSMAEKTISPPRFPRFTRWENCHLWTNDLLFKERTALTSTFI